MTNIVELMGVEKRYQGVQALKPLDLVLQQGEVLGLFGHNGAGKTTTIKLILGLIKASAGSVRVFGQDPTLSESRRTRYQLGFLQENVSFYEQLTGFEVLRYFARLKGIQTSECHRLLEQVGLKAAAARRVKTYSKGMRQRLGLAQALLGNPKLLLLDEPTVGLDPLATQDFYHRIAQLKEQGCTVVLCSHVLPGVEKYIDRALIMGKGAVLAQGSLDMLRLQAELPLTLNVKGSGLNIPEGLHSRATVLADGVSLTLSLQEKMPVMQHMLAQGGVTDIDLHLPSLEDLYTHYTRACVGHEMEGVL
ncbi:ABC transporter ATP-binding protein [Neptunomonas antarctica]|uniref:Cu-processing system ATP-binding protein n=1 Tax=Neptunomonas antarctica TaxID=619304 RepID=A0A1N7J021_9GAMM|nr:ABC transporter ATP-binding protein [Neptunomonas antarctica]SIS42732.1 Cu-processing system ATP-binding protein [Neptunomonas antarctica]